MDGSNLETTKFRIENGKYDFIWNIRHDMRIDFELVGSLRCVNYPDIGTSHNVFYSRHYRQLHVNNFGYHTTEECFILRKYNSTYLGNVLVHQHETE